MRRLRLLIQEGYDTLIKGGIYDEDHLGELAQEWPEDWEEVFEEVAPLAPITIYTVIPYNSVDNVIFHLVKSFRDEQQASEYAASIGGNHDIVDNQLLWKST